MVPSSWLDVAQQLVFTYNRENRYHEEFEDFERMYFASKPTLLPPIDFSSLLIFSCIGLPNTEIFRYIALWEVFSNAFSFYHGAVISPSIILNQSINQTSIVPISPAKPGSVARQPNQCSAAKSRRQFRNINRPWGVTVSVGERPNQRDVSSDI